MGQIPNKITPLSAYYREVFTVTKNMQSVIYLFSNRNYDYSITALQTVKRMAALTNEPGDRFYSVSLNADTNSARKYVNCVLKQRQIEDILSHLKSLQTVIETLKQDSSYEHGKDFDDQVTDDWYSRPSIWRFNEFKEMRFGNNLSSHSMVCPNEYSILSSSTGSPYQEESKVPNLTEGRPYPFGSYVKRRDQVIPKNRVFPRRLSNKAYQLKTYHQEVKDDLLCEQSVNNIPTIVNGHLNFNNQPLASDNNINTLRTETLNI
jgi:hypothetical protein